MLQPHKLYDEVVNSKLAAKGPLTAWRGKLARGDSRVAYVTRNDVPIASFWSEQEATAFVRKNG